MQCSRANSSSVALPAVPGAMLVNDESQMGRAGGVGLDKRQWLGGAISVSLAANQSSRGIRNQSRL